MLGPYSAADQRETWLRDNGYLDPFIVRYLRWLVALMQGDWGQSVYYREPVITLLPPYLWNTAILTGISLLVMVPVAWACWPASARAAGSTAWSPSSPC